MANEVETQVIDAKGLNRTITRLAHEIVERNRDVENLVVLGIRTRGVPLAQRIVDRIEEIEDKPVPLGILDVTMYRDDVFKNIKQPVVGTTEIKFGIDGKVVILVDDVLFTGRTVRAALDAIIDFGRPMKIQLAVLIDRGFRELPIRADYVGQSLITTLDEQVKVNVKEIDGQDGVFLVKSLKET
ncbi:bifunctional pyr operon transcriptional regulator/uracil phosphoribosyltransferase PyrR [candidate division KSB1 bacterium]|nr:bifunctional pyr operon transcriptional regulator/uracil phosphoribosyltransferase PyrR [candidate division KSB1 bacterium]NIR68456.1 bifunctional pyr operon transcriptional regulator/uracil phosphoribosyltransferase PyrR [candidate division KSB1 bacterium]NIS25107.1 bifunctional pyr operon transcriptional regulator/uracil phosphoribosyltransferase PyrR [candidate division KSB1 bacterium]NIT72019.1 bifunctional pyr operon transcriptional regulator/uracil phosphoribosyltransferase PyrR [candid